MRKWILASSIFALLLTTKVFGLPYSYVAARAVFPPENIRVDIKQKPGWYVALSNPVKLKDYDQPFTFILADIDPKLFTAKDEHQRRIDVANYAQQWVSHVRTTRALGPIRKYGIVFYTYTIFQPYLLITHASIDELDGLYDKIQDEENKSS